MVWCIHTHRWYHFEREPDQVEYISIRYPSILKVVVRSTCTRSQSISSTRTMHTHTHTLFSSLAPSFSRSLCHIAKTVNQFNCRWHAQCTFWKFCDVLLQFAIRQSYNNVIERIKYTQLTFWTRSQNRSFSLLLCHSLIFSSLTCNFYVKKKDEEMENPLQASCSFISAMSFVQFSSGGSKTWVHAVYNASNGPR